jgi:hypothetical protein
MLRSVTSFRGETPLITPRLLPPGSAQAAVNSRLYTGDLTAFQQFSMTQGLANVGPVQTISLMAAGTPYEVWLSWDQQVDVARGTVPGDTTYRTYLTGLDAPRFTNLALATTGGPPYPGTTRLLGVPPPDTVPSLVVGVDSTPTTFSVDIYDDCSDLSTNWAISPGQVNSGTYVSTVTQDGAFGNPAPSFMVEANNNNSTPAYASRDFGTSGATVIHASWDFNVRDVGGNAGFVIPFMFACDSTGDGPRIFGYGTIGGEIEIGVAVGTSFASGNGSLLASGTSGVPDSCNGSQWYTVDATLSVNPDGTMTIDANISLGSVQLASVTTTNTFTYGGVFGPMVAKGNDFLQVNYDNILVQAAGNLGTTITDIATSYVYTFVNDLGEESAPSLPSATILRPDGVAVTVTTPTSLPSGVSESDYFVETKRIYRAATGSTGTAFLFVAEIPLSQADYVDTLTDTALGEVLPSDIWELPPSDLEGILALPNGVMVGFSKNQLCFSAQNYPHAWPVSYRLNTDTDIVGIGNIDTTVVIGTQSFLYVASGNDPSAYSMSKFEVPHAASSKLSFAYITGLGVVFSGPQGLMVVRGIGQASNLTEEVFTLRQWKALDPTSIFSVAHDDIYFMFWNNGTDSGCYAVDLRQGGFGVAEMAFHASAAYVDPITDTMYLVLDQDFEPDTAVLPIPPSAPVYTDGLTIYEFEGDDTQLMTFRWRTQLWLEPYPAFHSIAQVRAESYDNLVARFYGDGVLLDEIVVDGEVEFTLTPPDEAYSTFEMELIGTDTVRELMAADDVLELDGLSQVQQYNTVGAG